MSFLEKIGLARKKATHTTGLNDKARLEEESNRRKNMLLKSFTALFFLVGIMLLYPRDFTSDLSYQLNEPWKQEDLTAPFDFSILKTDDEISAEIQQIRRNTAPIFHINPDIPERVTAQVDSVMNRLEPVLEAYTEWQISREDNSDSAESDSLSYIRTRANANLFFTDDNLDFMLEQYARVQMQEQRRSFVGNDVRNRLDHLLNEVYRDGIIDIDKDELESNEISVRNTRDRTERIVSINTIRDMEEADELVSHRLSRMFRSEAASIATQLYRQVVEPNLIFSESETDVLVQEEIEAISPTKGAVTAGQVIIRRGDLINQETLNKLESLEAARATRASNVELAAMILGDFMLLLAILATFLIYLYLYRRAIFDSNSKFLLVFIALFLVVGTSAFMIRIDAVSEFIVPLALAPILLTIFFDSRVGIIAAISISLMTGMMNGFNFEFMTATLVASSIGVYTVRDIRQRSQYFLNTPGLIFLSYTFVLLSFTLSRGGAWDVLAMNLLAVFVNVLLISILTYPLIFLFEKIFRITTDVTLYELNDNNNPILRDLMTQAPGSFQHSIQVSNLAESAASAIGANALLARVGGLYHDIGKMDKPQYFVENQSPGNNPHDQLSPSMSAKIIREHVKMGVKRAEKEDLPPIIVDFIRTHHGDSLIQYFYNKAKENADTENEVQEHFFRYDGPLPSTKETGILLLADCVEAASRAMSDPTYKKLENLVNRLVDERVAEGQLEACPLTFSNITAIKQAFLKILSAMYHSRIKYPGQDAKDKAGEEAPADSGVKPEKEKSEESATASPTPDHSAKASS